MQESFTRGMAGQDHNPEFRSLAISCSVTLFGHGSEAPPLQCFRTGYSCGDLSFRRLLEGLLMACGVPDVAKTADRLADLADKYHLHGNVYRKSRHAAGFAPLAMSPVGGHMLQLFVHKDYVDSLAYRSHPMGVRVKDPLPISTYLLGVRGTGGSAARSKAPTAGWGGRAGAAGGSYRRRMYEENDEDYDEDYVEDDEAEEDYDEEEAYAEEHYRSAHTARQVQGQARLFMHPDVFLDSKRAKMYHYCANMTFFNTDPDTKGSRAAFLQELRAMLKEIFHSPELLDRAWKGVQAL
eukprot:m.145305 g.145305  ORF g.145305 m.145305 type:complete len:295 (-) comp20489_c5_seq2:31-915(-)